MPQAVEELYNTLTLTAQQEVYDFMMYLVQKQEKLNEAEKNENYKKMRREALSQMSGSMKDTWKDIDALEYQKTMREERNLG